jgi:DNA repair ATPase RecN
MGSDESSDRDRGGAEYRPDTDDYDLLTFGEVAARISEKLAEETAELERVCKDAHPDPDRIRQIEERITLLRTSGDRYRQEERTNESFTRRFGSVRGQPAGQRPQWH